MAYLDDLKTRRDAVAARLAAATTGGGQSLNEPSMSVDGQSVDVDGHVRRLYSELSELNRLIAAAEPFEYETVAY